MYYGTLCSGVILLMYNFECKNIFIMVKLLFLYRNFYIIMQLLWRNFNIFNNFIATCIFLFCDGITPSQKTVNFNIFIDFVTGFTFCDGTKLSQKIEILLFKKEIIIIKKLFATAVHCRKNRKFHWFNTFCDGTTPSQKQCSWHCKKKTISNGIFCRPK